MPIETLLKRPVETLPADASCTEAADLMRKENIGAVVVSEAGRPLGVVTDRDIVVRVVAEGLDPLRTPLRDVMSGEPIFLSEGRGLNEVIASMRDLAVRRVPVVDAEGLLKGIISLDDLVVLLADELADLAQTIRREIQVPD